MTEPSTETPVYNATTHPVMQLLEIMRDLDRCEHGRHQYDSCGSCGSASKGNPILPTGMHLGYSIDGRPIYMPSRDDKHDPAKWFETPAAPEEAPTAEAEEEGDASA